MQVTNFKALLIDELEDLYNAEQQLLGVLPKMAQSAGNSELRQAFSEHQKQTQGHVNRLEKVFEELGEKPAKKTCYAMAGLIKEGQELMDAQASPALRDAGLIGAAQKVEHYEIAGYGTARTHAECLGNQAAARLLEQTLKEESQANERLNVIAQQQINAKAAEEG